MPSSSPACRGKFLAALAAEGHSRSSGGYTPLNKSRSSPPRSTAARLRRSTAKEAIAEWDERNHCPENDKLCEEAVWFTQTMLLGPRSDMDRIADAIRKIQASAAEAARA